MTQHEAMQLAPAIIVEIARVSKSRRKGVSGQQRESVVQALQDEDIASILGGRDCWHVEKVDAGRTDAAAAREGLQQMPQRDERVLVFGQWQTEGSKRRIDGVAEDLSAPDAVNGCGHARRHVGRL